MLYAPVTAPLLTAEDLDGLVARFAASDPAVHDAAAFVLERQGHFWYGGSALNYDPTYQENSQLAPPLLQLVYSAAVLDRSPARSF